MTNTVLGNEVHLFPGDGRACSPGPLSAVVCEIDGGRVEEACVSTYTIRNKGNSLRFPEIPRWTKTCSRSPDKDKISTEECPRCVSKVGCRGTSLSLGYNSCAPTASGALDFGWFSVGPFVRTWLLLKKCNFLPEVFQDRKGKIKGKLVQDRVDNTKKGCARTFCR